MKKKLLTVLVVCAVLLGALTVYSLLSRSRRNTVDELIVDKKLINVLIAGSNVYNNNTHRFFAVVTVNPVNSNVGVTSIPPSYRVVTDERKGKTARIDQVDFDDFDDIKKSLLKSTNLNIHYYVELYSPDVVRIIDLFEGIDLFVLDQVRGLSNINFGENYFDGKKVVGYINSVEEQSIYLKYDRIMDILLTLYYKREKLKPFNSIPFVNEVVRRVKTNLLPQEIVRIGQVIMGDGRLTSIMLPGGFEDDFYVVDDVSFALYQNEFIKPLILDTGDEQAVKIRILNGTNMPGLARKMRNSLIRDGMNVVEFGTSSYKKLKHSIIINRKGSFSAVEKVSEITGIDKIYHIIDNTRLNNILIIIGEDLAY